MSNERLDFHGDLFVDRVPKLTRGRVWCIKCGITHRVNAGECLRSGWPKCCGQTMTIDSPEERGIYTQEVGLNGDH